MKIIMRVSNDEYELPEIVADSLEELAEIEGITYKCACQRVRLSTQGKAKRYKYCIVDID